MTEREREVRSERVQYASIRFGTYHTDDFDGAKVLWARAGHTPFWWRPLALLHRLVVLVVLVFGAKIFRLYFLFIGARASYSEPLPSAESCEVGGVRLISVP
jgi:hypothetical protein